MSTSLFGLMAILAMVLGLASASATQVRSDHGVSRDTAKGDDAGSDEPDSDDSSSSDSGD